MKVLMENFSENIRDQMPENVQNENYRYIQEKQEKEDDELKNAVIKQQKGRFDTHERGQPTASPRLESQGVEIVPTMKLHAEITKMALTLYLGESDLVSATSKELIPQAYTVSF